MYFVFEISGKGHHLGIGIRQRLKLRGHCRDKITITIEVVLEGFFPFGQMFDGFGYLFGKTNFQHTFFIPQLRKAISSRYTVILIQKFLDLFLVAD
jgi:hypothetical protein